MNNLEEVKKYYGATKIDHQKVTLEETLNYIHDTFNNQVPSFFGAHSPYLHQFL